MQCAQTRDDASIAQCSFGSLTGAFGSGFGVGHEIKFSGRAGSWREGRLSRYRLTTAPVAEPAIATAQTTQAPRPERVGTFKMPLGPGRVIMDASIAGTRFELGK